MYPDDCNRTKARINMQEKCGKGTRSSCETTGSKQQLEKIQDAQVRRVLRGTIVNRTYGIHINLPGTYLTIFTNNIWSF